MCEIFLTTEVVGLKHYFQTIYANHTRSIKRKITVYGTKFNVIPMLWIFDLPYMLGTTIG
jgi:hypothetical protein